MPVGLLVLIAAVLWSAAGFAQEPLKEEAGFVRIRLNERSVRLETLVVRPEKAEGRLPLALITHGKSASTVAMGETRPRNYAWLARDLARRGWIAAVVIRRGFGQSNGPGSARATCANTDFGERLGEDASELAAAIDVLRERDDVDGDRIVAIGESAGGAAVLGLAQARPAGLRGVINLAGGLALEGCEDKSREALVRTMTAWQKPDTPPQLWIYAANDTLFPPPLVERMRSAALDAGDDIRFVELPAVRPNGHLIFNNTSARFAWMKELDASLRAWELPTWSPAEMRRHFVGLRLAGRTDSYDRYFSAPGEKAMALSRSRRSFTYVYGGRSLDEVKARALKNCSERATECVIAFENGRFMLDPSEPVAPPEAPNPPAAGGD